MELKTKERLFFTGLFLWIVMMVFVALTFASCQNNTRVKSVDTETLIIDSIWVKKPGEINTMQTDYRYFARLTNGKEIMVNSFTKVGDTVHFVFYNLEKYK